MVQMSPVCIRIRLRYAPVLHTLQSISSANRKCLSIVLLVVRIGTWEVGMTRNRPCYGLLIVIWWGVAKLATSRWWCSQIWLAFVCVVVVIDPNCAPIEHGLLGEHRIEKKGRPRLLDSIPSSLPIFGRPNSHPTHLYRPRMGVFNVTPGDMAGSEGPQVVALQGDVQQVGVERLPRKC